MCCRYTHACAYDLPKHLAQVEIMLLVAEKLIHSSLVRVPCRNTTTKTLLGCVVGHKLILLIAARCPDSAGMVSTNMPLKEETSPVRKNQHPPRAPTLGC